MSSFVYAHLMDHQVENTVGDNAEANAKLERDHFNRILHAFYSYRCIYKVIFSFRMSILNAAVFVVSSYLLGISIELFSCFGFVVR